MPKEFYVGFEDEENDIFSKPTDDEDDEAKKEEKRIFDEIHPEDMKVFIPPKKKQQMLDEYDCVVVNDFGDDYHLSEAEREKQNQFYTAFKQLRRCKRNYRNLKEFIEVFRMSLTCLDLVSEKNYVYTPEEFKSLVMKGKIEVNGLFFPKYKGKDRKEISWDYISSFILSDDPVSELAIGDQNDEDELITDEDYDEMTERLFPNGELEEIFNDTISEQDKILSSLPFDEDMTPSDKAPVAYQMDRKEIKKFIKAFPEYIVAIREDKRRKKKQRMLSSYAHELDISDMESIEEYDRRRNGILSQVKSEMPEFKGSLLNDNDYERYMHQLQEYEDTQIKVEYNNKMKTQEEIRELEINEAMESAGWNIRKMSANRNVEKQLSKSRKRDRKRQQEIKKALIKMKSKKNKNSAKKRLITDMNKKKKNKKDHKRSIEKAAKDISKQNKKYKDKVKEATNDLLLYSIDDDHDSFDDYKKDVLDWSWENIVKKGDDN